MYITLLALQGQKDPRWEAILYLTGGITGELSYSEVEKQDMLLHHHLASANDTRIKYHHSNKLKRSWLRKVSCNYS